MFVRLLLLFSIVPLVELALLIKMGSVVGVLPTVLLVCVTGITGAYLAKSQGFKLFRQVSESLEQGQIPADHLIEGLLILIGGVLLLTPGLITDISGFVLLIPFTRRLIARWGKHKFKQWIERGSMHFSYGEYRNAGTTRTAHDTEFRDWHARESEPTHHGATQMSEEGEKPPIDVEFEDIQK